MKTQKQIDVTIAIVNFETKNILRSCLNSILKNTKKLNLEILVVDNGSTDGSAKMTKSQFPQVILIHNSKNLFFSKAYNQALTKSQGKYFLILNSDTQVKNGTIEKLYRFMENSPQVAVVSPRQVNGSGELDSTCSRFPNPLVEFFESSLIGQIFKNPKTIKNYRYGNWQRNTLKKVDVVGGSFMFTRKSVIEELGGFDENFLLFYSDCDLCLRIKNAGFEIYFYPNITITHLKSKTIEQLDSWKLAKISLSDMIYYYRKHFGFLWWLFMWIVYRPNWLYWRLKSS